MSSNDEVSEKAEQGLEHNMIQTPLGRCSPPPYGWGHEGLATPVPHGSGRRPFHCYQCQHVVAATSRIARCVGQILSGNTGAIAPSPALPELPPTHARNPIDGTIQASGRRAALDAPRGWRAWVFSGLFGRVWQHRRIFRLLSTVLSRSSNHVRLAR